MKIPHPLLAAGTLAMALLAGCVTLRPAQIEMPAGLDAAAVESLPIGGIGGKARGTIALGDLSGHFERHASRLALLDATVTMDRAGSRFTLQRAGAEPVSASCRARQDELRRGILSLPARPMAMGCEWQGGAKLALEAELLAAGGTQDARKGRYEGGGVVLELRSVHRLQGTKLPTAQPVGYVMLHQGVPVGALSLADSGQPLVWRPRERTPLHEAVTQAAVALALLWDPASV